MIVIPLVSRYIYGIGLRTSIQVVPCWYAVLAKPLGSVLRRVLLMCLNTCLICFCDRFVQTTSSPSLPFLYLLYKFFMGSIFTFFKFCLGLFQFLVIFLNADTASLRFPSFYKGFQHLQYGFFFSVIQLKNVLQ